MEEYRYSCRVVLVLMDTFRFSGADSCFGERSWEALMRWVLLTLLAGMDRRELEEEDVLVTSDLRN